MSAPAAPYVRSPRGIPISVAPGDPCAGVISADPCLLYGFTLYPFGGGWGATDQAIIMFYDAAAPPADPINPTSPTPDAPFVYYPGIDSRLVVGAEFFGVKGQKFSTALSYAFIDASGGIPANAYTGGIILVPLIG